ncbi:MAG TPA: FIST N-terminal domain-containing protein [Anaerolineales bacterium]
MEQPFVFASAMTTESEADQAVQALTAGLASQMTGADPDLVALFLSADFTHQTRDIVHQLLVALNPRVLVGCTAEGVIGSAEEIERSPAISLVAGHLPGVSIEPFVVQPVNWSRTLSDEEEFRSFVGAEPDTKLFITLADPFSTPINDLLATFNRFYPGIPMAGGMASGAVRSGDNRLFINDQIVDGGVVGLSLGGSFECEVLVSQGCRPIWHPFTVESCKDNLILNLDGQPPLAWIDDLIPELPEDDRTLLQEGLFIGRAIDPKRETYGRGDFLIRSVIGVDQRTGAIAVGDNLQHGERIQFHLRDAVTAKEDLEMMLVPQVFRQPPSGALLFSCNGRGERLYDHPNGDVTIIQQNLGDIHMAGLFCAGEIGPVGGKNFLHGHTASLVLFRPVP